MSLRDYNRADYSHSVKEAARQLHAALTELEKLTPEELEEVSYIVTMSRVNLAALVQAAKEGAL
jgi:hypothetical protein